MPESRLGLPGWDSLLHGGLLLDGARQEAVARRRPEPLGDHVEDQLRRRAGAMLNGGGDPSAFAAFVLEEVCGLDAATGAWARGSNIPSAWGRRAVTGETVKPRHLWQGTQGGSLPVFLDDGKALGIGRSRRGISQVLGWLRNGGEHLALVTNGRHWRLLFAGLDYDAWCQWDLDLWFQEGELSAQVTALRILLHPAQWTPPAKGDAPPLLQAIRDTRKGQAELSEVLGERVREAVEILIQGHGEALAALAQGAPATAPATGMFNWATGLPKSGAQTDASGAARQGRAAVDPADIYRAACRVAMRLVVILFAESRDLLPRDNALYHSAYGLQGLLEQLQSAAGHGVPLTERHSAWPRVLALFRLVWQGSHFPELPVKDYGGELFAPAHEGRGHRAQGDDLPKRSPASAQAKPPLGEAAPGLPDESNRDGLSCALAVFENACFEDATLPDGDVLKMLELLTRTTVRVRQGRSSIRVAAPVDFSDLSSEYIGILYEGLLDYELKTAPADDPVIFLAVGDRPALPLSRLEAMNERAVKALFENLKEASAAQDEAAKDADEPAQEPPSPLNSLAPVGDPPAAGNVETPLASAAGGEGTRLEVRYARAEYRVAAADRRQQSRSRAEAWARSAAQTAGLASKHRGKITPERRLALDQQLQAKARQLIARVVLPGEWYLVRWGGTRKGSGTFYTRPGLAVPTVQRTLRPLAYDPPAKPDGAPNLEAPSTQWQPKRPEQILALKLCDPACGCGTFPLAALRFLTDALYDALQHHGRIEQDGERALVRLLGIADPQEAAPTPGERLGDASAPASARGGASAPGPTFGECLGDELIPCRPEDDSFEPRLKAVLRRHVVERCIYAVDLNPLAVELCRLSLWIETMDRTLPFSFLDHKIKCGNALVGAWFDQFAHYPAMAWKHREGGDKAHGNGVHFAKDIRGKALKAFVKDRLTPDLKLFLRGADLFQGDLLTAAATAHDKALRVLADMHDLPVQDAKTRAAKYRDEFLASPAWQSLKTAMDLWCACWFWPAEELDCAPLPRTFAAPSDGDPQPGGPAGASAALLPLGAGVPGRVRPARRRLRRDAGQSALGHRQAGFQGVLLQHRPAVPLLRQAGGDPPPVRLLRGRGGGARLAGLQRPLPRTIQLHGPRRAAVRRPALRRRPEPLCHRARPREPASARRVAQGASAIHRLRRPRPPVPAPGFGGPQLLQAVPGGDSRAAVPRRAAGFRGALRPLFGQRHRRAAPSVPHALPMGVAVRLREPRGPVSNSPQLQVQPGDRAEGRRHGGHTHRLHAPQPGRLGTRRGTGHALRRPPSGAIQPEEPSDSGNPIAAGLGDSGEDLRELGACSATTARTAGASATPASST